MSITHTHPVHIHICVCICLNLCNMLLQHKGQDNRDICDHILISVLLCPLSVPFHSLLLLPFPCLRQSFLLRRPFLSPLPSPGTQRHLRASHTHYVLTVEKANYWECATAEDQQVPLRKVPTGSHGGEGATQNRIPRKSAMEIFPIARGMIWNGVSYYIWGFQVNTHFAILLQVFSTKENTSS